MVKALSLTDSPASPPPMSAGMGSTPSAAEKMDGWMDDEMIKFKDYSSKKQSHCCAV